MTKFKFLHKYGEFHWFYETVKNVGDSKEHAEIRIANPEGDILGTAYYPDFAEQICGALNAVQKDSRLKISSTIAKGHLRLMSQETNTPAEDIVSYLFEHYYCPGVTVTRAIDYVKRAREFYIAAKANGAIGVGLLYQGEL